MNKKGIATNKAPQAIGPYSQAVGIDNFLFLSGQIALDPDTGELAKADIQLQTRSVMENLKAVLKAAGLTFDHVVKTTLFLTDMTQFPDVNEVYGSYFDQTPPARSTVEVAALPKGAMIEIEAIAVGKRDEG